MKKKASTFKLVQVTEYERDDEGNVIKETTTKTETKEE
jgi:YD repeat-containing protein